MLIHCIIIDDEPLARKGLREYIEDVEFLHLTGEFDNPLQATELLGTGAVDLIFLDIQMPKITGLEFIKTIKHPPPVIFTTAYPHYALEGFEVNAMDYLVKPVSFDRFLKAALKAKDYHASKAKNVAETAGGSDFFFIKSDNKLVKIQLDDVLFAEGLQNYVCIHTIQKKYITYLTFKAMEAYLPEDRFLKVHKSYIIAASKVESIDGNEVWVGGQHLPISRNLKEEVLDKLLKGKFLKR
ncbi:MAG: DNA-binding response regulator [Ferruginibacter sp.]|nr:DNA-binding response regulator [Ferruginibacter sp.]